jgi:hypothetical protein
MNIIRAMDDPNLFKPWFPGLSWDGWRTVLKAAYGLPMTAAELTFFLAVFGPASTARMTSRIPLLKQGPPT